MLLVIPADMFMDERYESKTGVIDEAGIYYADSIKL